MLEQITLQYKSSYISSVVPGAYIIKLLPCSLAKKEYRSILAHTLYQLSPVWPLVSTLCHHRKIKTEIRFCDSGRVTVTV
jgi:hypothetical protein